VEEYQKLYDVIVRLNKAETGDLLLFFHSVTDGLPEDFRNEFKDLFQILRHISEDLLRAFPEITADQVPKTKLSLRDHKRIEEALNKLEEWNERFLKRAIVLLFFARGDVSPDQVEHIVHSRKALERIRCLRSAIETIFIGDSNPIQLLLDKNDIPSGREQLPYSNLWVTEAPVFSNTLQQNCGRYLPMLSLHAFWSSIVDTVTMRIRR